MYRRVANASHFFYQLGVRPNAELSMDVFHSAMLLDAHNPNAPRVVPKHPHPQPRRQMTALNDTSTNVSSISSSSSTDELDSHRYHRRWYVADKGIHRTGGVAPSIAWGIAYISHHSASLILEQDIPSFIMRNIPTKRFKKFMYSIQQFIADQLNTVARIFI